MNSIETICKTLQQQKTGKNRNKKASTIIDEYGLELTLKIGTRTIDGINSDSNTSVLEIASIHVENEFQTSSTIRTLISSLYKNAKNMNRVLMIEKPPSWLENVALRHGLIKCGDIFYKI